MRVPFLVESINLIHNETLKYLVDDSKEIAMIFQAYFLQLIYKIPWQTNVSVWEDHLQFVRYPDPIMALSTSALFRSTSTGCSLFF